METSRFPNRIKEIRVSLGYTQKEVAELLELAHSGNISRWEKGLVLPSLIHLIELSILYQTTIEYVYPDMWLIIKKDIEAKVLFAQQEQFKNKLTESMT